MVATARELVEGYDGERKSAIKQAKLALEEKLGQLKTLDEEIQRIICEDENSTQEALQEDMEASGKIRAEMQECVILIEDILASGAETSDAPSTSNASIFESNTSTPQPTNIKARLPKLEVRKFNGKVHEWQEFWNSFRSAIHDNTQLSDVDKFCYLRGLIEGPAKATIAGFSLTADNYNTAVELLGRRFGKKVAIERAHVSQLLNVQPVYSAKDVRGLRIFHDTVETHYRGLCALDVNENTYSSIVVPTLLEKIPDPVRLMITRGEDYMNWAVKDLLKALLTEVELRKDYRLTTQAKPVLGGNVGSHRKPYNASALQVNRDKDRCAFCMGRHAHEDCEKIKDSKERKTLIRKFGRCFKCLEKGHRARDCHLVIICKNCTGAHHSALCESKANENKTGAQIENGASTHTNMLVGSSSRIALQTAQAKINGSRNGNRVRVLFDSGSHKSFVTVEVARAHNLKVLKKEWLSISTFGRNTTDSGLRDVVLVDLIPVSGGRNLTLEAYVVPEISRISNEHVEVVKKDFSHLRDLWFSDVCRTKEELEIDLLIGSDYIWKFQRGQTIRGEPEEPVAIETELGYVLSGPLKPCEGRGYQEYSVNFVSQQKTDTSVSLDSEVRKLWDLESIGIRVNDEVHETFENEISFSDGKYSVKLPWRKGHDTLPSNYVHSLGRMQNQLRKLRKDPDVLAEYDAIIKDQLQTGVIETVAALEKPNDKLHYLPHQAVIRKDAETTKIRIVYDASAKESKSGVALNDCLHTGPSLNPLLFDILVRFRENKVALVGDIEKAFLNIEADPGDRDCLRFLWVDDYRKETPEIIVYRFCRVVFGLNASPFLLNATIRHHLNKYVSTDPYFVQKMLEGFYVDDLVSGGNTTEDAFELYDKAKICMENGGFRMRKWKTNDLKLRQKIEQSERSMHQSEIIPTVEEDETYAKSKLDPHSGAKGEKVLGLSWNIENDTIHFQFEHISRKKERLEPTKRNLLSLLSSLFDPLGLISGVVVSMKILFQDVCKNKLGWDEVFSDDMKKRLDQWVSDLIATREICVDRCLYNTNTEKISKCYLHGFGDASKRAYCAVVYLVYHTENEEARARLIASKTRVAPLKEMSIPRLELMAARILAQLVNTIRSALSTQLKLDGVRYWLDSKTALCWIRNRGEWKQFVKHRVNEILQLTNKDERAYVSTHENPADIGSRGVLVSQLKNNELWWNGPTWLAEKPNDWPPNFEIGRTPESSEEEKKSVTNLFVEKDQQQLSGLRAVISIKRYSSLTKLLNVTAWVRRAVSNFKRKHIMIDLTAEEIKTAEIDWIKIAQCELKQQDNYRQLTRKLGLVDEDGILKCTGRLVNSDLDLDVQKPILLPKQHQFTRLIIEACHRKVHHRGVRSTLAELRSRFWVPKGRQMVKRILSECFTCKRLTGKSYRAPATAALPEFRVTRASPFSKVGIDFAGPLYAKISKIQNNQSSSFQVPKTMVVVFRPHPNL